MSLRLRILFLVLIATMLPAILLGVHRVDQREVERVEAERSLQALATYVAESLRNTANGTVQLLHGLSRAPELEGDRGGCSSFLKEVLERFPQYTGLLTISPDGLLSCDSLSTGRIVDLNDRGYFNRAKVSSEPVFEAVLGRLTGKAVLQVAYPMRATDGRLKGVLLASLDLPQFSSRIVAASSLVDLEMRVWDGSGQLLLRLPDPGPVKLVGNRDGETPLYRFVRSDLKKNEVAELRGPDGVHKTWARSGLPDAGEGGVWMAVGVPHDSLLAEANGLFRRELMYLAVISLITLMVALVFAEIAIRWQLARIISSATRQGAGELSARIGEPFPRGDLGELMETLDATAAAVESQHAQLRQQSIELRKSNRTLRLLGTVATMSASEPSREALLTDVCRVAVEEGGFRVAWVCILDRLTMHCNAVAWSGADRAFVDEQIRGTVGDASHSGPAPFRSPTLASTGNVLPAIDMEALELGAQAVGMFPLMVEGQQAGWLALYAAAPGAFDADEVQLLGQLARDVGVALELIDKSARLQYVARFDTLTGLANRTLFNNRLRDILGTPEGRARGLALVVMDIERFGRVNETWGRHIGDALLQRIAVRLSRHVSESQALARIGADHFAIMLVDQLTREAFAARLERLHQAVFDAPFMLPAGEANLSAHYGVAVFPRDGDDVELLFRNAETAVKNVKMSGDRVCFYDASMAALRAEYLTLENQVRGALELDEFVLHYEPKADLVTREIIGVEARMSWNSPQLGLMPPARFMALLENTGLVTQVGMWALQRAARDHGNWARAGHRPPRIAVNVSPLQLRERGFVDQVALAIREDVTPAGIDLEITEALVMEDVEATIVKLQEIRALGLDIAIDSFGTGYSSLSYLTRLPVQILKIDKSFIERMLDDRDAMTMVSTMISLAHALRLKVVAVGVETEAQAKVLHLLTCDQMQGGLAGPPMSAVDLAATL